MKIYIAGRISGDPDYEEKFKRYKRTFSKLNAVVLNPAELPQGLSVADYMRICFAMIDVADTVVFLPDWERSGGAQLEKEYCEYTGKPTMVLKERGTEK